MMKVNSKIQETNHRSPLFHLMYHRDDVEFSIHDCVLEILSLPFLSKRCGRSAVFDAAFLALAVEPTSARLPSCSAFRASATRKTAGAEPKRCGLRRLWACRTEEESEWEHRNGMVWWENGGWWEKPVRFWYSFITSVSSALHNTFSYGGTDNFTRRPPWFLCIWNSSGTSRFTRQMIVKSFTWRPPWLMCIWDSSGRSRFTCQTIVNSRTRRPP
ncbi:hypothetical protein J6590_063354 [Homalodisca vitripennis]|nr:hypothetical protein J6590_063354 [Homalodisca vitripennis]